MPSIGAVVAMEKDAAINAALNNLSAVRRAEARQYLELAGHEMTARTIPLWSIMVGVVGVVIEETESLPGIAVGLTVALVFAVIVMSVAWKNKLRRAIDDFRDADPERWRLAVTPVVQAERRIPGPRTWRREQTLN